MHALGFTQGVHGGQVLPQAPDPLSPWEVGVAGLTRSRKGHLPFSGESQPIVWPPPAPHGACPRAPRKIMAEISLQCGSEPNWNKYSLGDFLCLHPQIT